MRDLEDLTSTLSEAEMNWARLISVLEGTGKRSLLDFPRVLDLGCRRGVLLKYLASIDVQAVGVDVSVSADVVPDVDVVTANAVSLPFEDSEFNIVYSFGLLDPTMYEFDFIRILGEVSRVTMKGGVFYIVQRKHPDVKLATSLGWNVLLANDGDFISLLERS